MKRLFDPKHSFIHYFPLSLARCDDVVSSLLLLCGKYTYVFFLLLFVRLSFFFAQRQPAPHKWIKQSRSSYLPLCARLVDKLCVHKLRTSEGGGGRLVGRCGIFNLSCTELLTKRGFLNKHTMLLASYRQRIENKKLLRNRARFKINNFFVVAFTIVWIIVQWGMICPDPITMNSPSSRGGRRWVSKNVWNRCGALITWWSRTSEGN